MRLTEWRVGAPNREALSGRVLDVVVPVLEALGSEADPHCWVAWGDDPAIRYVIFAPSAAGLISCSVRLPQPGGEGPRASGRVVRWHRVQLGELAIETVGGHRLVSFQVESQVLRGADDAADRIGAFALALFAAVDGRPMPDLGARKRRRKSGTAKAGSRAGSKAGAKKAGPKKAAASARPGDGAPQPAARSADVGPDSPASRASGPAAEAAGPAPSSSIRG